MSTNVIQTSFAAGELSPALYARTDLGKYHVGAETVENFVVDFKGGVFNRPGTKFMQRAKGGGTGQVRIIDFQFSTVQSYILEFGDQYIRFYAQGAPVLETAKTITGITQANPGVATTSTAHGYSNGDWVVIDDVLGMIGINGMTVQVQGVTSTTFQLYDLDGNPLNTNQFTTYISGGTSSRVYTLASPYAAADLALLKYTQSADVMTITHPSYAPRDLNRLGNANWTLTTITFGTTAVAPTGVTITPSSAGTSEFAYTVTTISTEGEESVMATPAGNNTCVDIRSTAGSIKISWTAAADAKYYKVYKTAPSVAASGIDLTGASYGWVADAFGTSAIDDNITPDYTITPPLHVNPFNASEYPGAVAYFQQRRIYGGSGSRPETLWMSQPGNFNNFDAAVPVKDDDAIQVTLASKQVNNIKHMVGMPGGLIVLTGSSAWQISGGQASSAVTPASLVATPQAYTGCADLPPIVINYDILFVQARGNVVRDLAYNFYVNIYTGIDISLLSNHLLIGYQLKEWAYCEEPYKVVWAVRSDGELLSLTYLKEQEVYGWAHHHTLGRFMSVASVQEGTENVLYCVVQRYINGKFVQYVERMQSRQLTYGVEDSWFLDCALTNDPTYPAATITASASTGTGVTFTTDVAVFSLSDVGSIIRMGGGIAKITSFQSNVKVTGDFIRDITDTLYGDSSVYPGAAYTVPMPQTSGNWTITAPISVVSGLNHLEGQTVGVLVDGSVQSDKVVTFGTITLDSPGTKIVVGLRYASRLKTLRLDVGEPSVQGKRKKISALTVRVQDTRGLKMGSTWNTLMEYKMRNTQPMGTPIDLMTGDQRIIMDPSWSVEGQICIRQDYPLPATVLGVIPEIAVGDTPSK